MKRYNYLFCVLFALLSGTIFTACSEDESYDFPGDADNKVYIQAAGTTDFVITHTPLASATNFDFSVKAGVRMPSSNELTVSLAVDPSLVAAYNAAHATNYSSIPSDYFNTTNVTVPADTLKSAAQAEITLKEEYVRSLTNENGYLVPVRITSVSEGALPSSNLNVVYAIIKIESDKDNIDDKGEVTGTLNTDRTGWTATTSIKTSDMTSYANAFDDDETSTWSTSASESFDVIFDMGKTYNISGLYANYKEYAYWNQAVITSGTEIFVSEDNNTWVSQGAVTKSDQNVAFYAPVKARYVKWQVPVVSSWQGKSAKLNIGDFNVYVK